MIYICSIPIFHNVNASYVIGILCLIQILNILGIILSIYSRTLFCNNQLNILCKICIYSKITELNFENYFGTYEIKDHQKTISHMNISKLKKKVGHHNMLIKKSVLRNITK